MATPSAGHRLITAAKVQALLQEPTRITSLMTSWLLGTEVTAGHDCQIYPPPPPPPASVDFRLLSRNLILMN